MLLIQSILHHLEPKTDLLRDLESGGVTRRYSARLNEAKNNEQVRIYEDMGMNKYIERKISTKEKLQKIHEEIETLEKYKECTEQTRKKLVGSFIAFNIFFCVITATVCYFYYLPPTLEEKFLYALPFAGFIVIIYIIKNLLTCYYRWKMRRNENKLTKLKDKKAEILDQVMETETYKVAKEILEIFAPEQIRKNSLNIKSPLVTPIGGSQRMTVPQSGDVRRRIVSPQSSQIVPVRPGATPFAAAQSSSYSYGKLSMTPRPQQHTYRPRNESDASKPPNISNVADVPPGPPMPRPILPRERGILDRFVEYLVGDGPSNRYALVCRQCESHNGMALKDEFPYIAFRCAYCFYWNPARKQKPAPPRLETIRPRVSSAVPRRIVQEEESSCTSDDEEDETESDSSSASNLSCDAKDDKMNTNRSSLSTCRGEETAVDSKDKSSGVINDSQEDQKVETCRGTEISSSAAARADLNTSDLPSSISESKTSSETLLESK